MQFQLTHSSADILQFPLVAPFAVATRTAYETRNVVIRLTVKAGQRSQRITGLGAAAPVPYVTGETHEGALATLRAALSHLAEAKELCEMRLRPMLRLAGELTPGEPSARAALEMALYDLWGQARGVPLWHHFGAAQDTLTADLTIPIVAPEDAGEQAAKAWEQGFRHLKIKVGGADGHDADCARLAAVAKAAPRAVLRVDANQAFTPDAAVDLVRRALAVAPRIEIVEQPVAKEDIDGLSRVHKEMRRLGMPVLLFADESAQTVASVVELLRRGAVDGVNVKLMKSGLTGALEIAGLCRTHGAKLMVGCMLESLLPLNAACALVAGSGLFDYIDLDSHHLLSPSNVFAGGMAHDGPQLFPEKNRPGWGVFINESEWNKAVEPSV